MKQILIAILLIFVSIALVQGQDKKSKGKKPCFSAEQREKAERIAKVYRPPGGYDPVLGYDPATGPQRGAARTDKDGRGLPFICSAAKKPSKITGTLPKFYCSVSSNTDEDGDLIRYKIKPQFKGASPEKRNGEIYGEFLSSRFSKAVGFFADDVWISDVTCADCQSSLSKPFQGVAYTPFQPAAGIELSIGKGIDVDCSDDDSATLETSLKKLLANGAPRAEIDAFKLWLAFIDHGDTKADNQSFACLNPSKASNVKVCETSDSIFYVSDMGSTFGFSADSEKKATLALWKKKDPIKVSNGRCSTPAKSVGDTQISEAGRALLAENLQRLLDAEKQSGLITRVFKASRNDERDQPAAAWTAEFTRKAKLIIDARCSAMVN